MPPRSRQQLVHIHVDSNELGRVYQADLAIQSSHAAAAALLASLSAPAGARWADWSAGARQDFEEFSLRSALAAGSSGVDLGAVVAQLDRILPDDAILTNGAGNYTIWLHRHYRYRQPRTQLAPTCGAMGYGFPAALAAARRHPDKTVVCFAGDGCFLMYPQELATAVQYGIPMVVIVCNNGMYGTIRMHQEKRFPGRVSATTLQGPDFVALAQSFGAYGERVEKEEDFLAAFERARASGKPALLELIQDPRQITPGMRLP
jgi:acetolactate synthase-1/2/3 large subunit